MKCRNCSRDIPDNSIFCNWCGKKQLVEKQKETSVPRPRQLPSGSWSVQIMRGGKRVRITAPTESECIARAMSYKAELSEAAAPAPKRTLHSVVSDYIESRSAVLSPSTIRSYRSILRSRFLPWQPRQVSSIDFQRMINQEASLCSPKSLKNAWGLFSSALQSVGISARVTLPTVPKSSRPWLSSDEIPVFLDAIRGQPCELPALLALHSLRRGEVYGLSWDDISADSIHVHSVLVRGDSGIVEKPNPKNLSSDRYVPIFIPRLSELLNAVPAGQRHGRVIGNSMQTDTRRIKRISIAAGLPPCTMHSLRHSFASLCHRLRIPILEVQRIGGWSDYETLRKIYTHLDEADSRAATASLSAYFSHELLTEK